MGDNLQDKQILQILKFADLDKDNKVTLSDFQRIYQSN